jgi:uncharacterized protein (UPF0335 family)
MLKRILKLRKKKKKEHEEENLVWEFKIDF